MISLLIFTYLCENWQSRVFKLFLLPLRGGRGACMGRESPSRPTLVPFQLALSTFSICSQLWDNRRLSYYQMLVLMHFLSACQLLFPYPPPLKFPVTFLFTLQLLVFVKCYFKGGGGDDQHIQLTGWLPDLSIVCVTDRLLVSFVTFRRNVTQRFPEKPLRHIPKNGCDGD